MERETKVHIFNTGVIIVLPRFVQTPRLVSGRPICNVEHGSILNKFKTRQLRIRCSQTSGRDSYEEGEETAISKLVRK